MLNPFPSGNAFSIIFSKITLKRSHKETTGKILSVMAVKINIFLCLSKTQFVIVNVDDLLNRDMGNKVRHGKIDFIAHYSSSCSSISLFVLLRLLYSALQTLI